MNNSKFVPETSGIPKPQNPANYKILTIIASCIVAFQMTLSFVVDDPVLLVYVSSTSIPLAVAFLCFWTVKNMSNMPAYTKSITALGIGFVGLFLGEFTYFLYEQVFFIDPYPSIADVFYYLLYAMTATYLIIQIKFFSVRISFGDKILIAVIPITITLSYSIFSSIGIEKMGFDYFFGVFFVATSSICLGLAVYGIKLFHDGLVGTMWILLASGIMMFTLGDSWYYYLELYEAYDLKHPVLSMWYGGYALIGYSLVALRKIL